MDSADRVRLSPVDVTPVREAAGGPVGRFEAVFDRAPVGIGIVNLAGHTTATNDVLRRRLGYSREELDAVPFAAHSHADDLAANLVLFARLVAGEIDHFEMEKRFLCKDGGIIRLADTLHLAAICEGIETPGQLADLQAAGCAYGQGDLLGLPGPLADIPATIELAASRPQVSRPPIGP